MKYIQPDARSLASDSQFDRFNTDESNQLMLQQEMKTIIARNQRDSINNLNELVGSMIEERMDEQSVS